MWNEDGKQIVVDLDKYQVTEEFELGIARNNNVAIASQYYVEKSKRYYIVTNQHWEIWIYDSTVNQGGSKKKLDSFVLVENGAYSLMHSPLVIDERNQRGYVTTSEMYVLVFDLKTKKIISNVVASNNQYIALNQKSNLVAISQESVNFSTIKLYKADSFELIRQIRIDDQYISLFTNQFDPFENDIMTIYGGENLYAVRDDGEILFQASSRAYDYLIVKQYGSEGKILFYCYSGSYDGVTTGRFEIFENTSGRPISSIPPVLVEELGTPPWTRPTGIFAYQDFLYIVMNDKIARIKHPEVPEPDNTNHLIFPLVRHDRSAWTGIGLSGNGDMVTATAVTQNGELVPEIYDITNPKEWDLEGQNQVAKFPQEIFGQGLISQEILGTVDELKSIEVIFPPDQQFTGFTLSGDSSYSLFLDGIIAVNPKQTDTTLFLPMEKESYSSRIVGLSLYDHQQIYLDAFVQDGTKDYGSILWMEKRLGLSEHGWFYFPENYYYALSSADPFLGYAILGKTDLSFFPGIYLKDKSKELVFAQNASSPGFAKTELIVINPGQQQSTDLFLYKDDGTLQKKITRNIPANGMIWESTADLFNVPEAIGYLKVTTSGDGILGWVRFQIGPTAEAALVAQTPMLKAQFNHVAQVKPTKQYPLGMNYGLTILNLNSVPIDVQVQALLPDGTVTGTAVVTLAPNQKLARHLNEPELFGSAFSQGGGRLVLTSLTDGKPFVSFCLLYQTYYSGGTMKVLAAIPGQPEEVWR